MIDRVLAAIGIAFTVTCGYYLSIIFNQDDTFNVFIAIVGTIASIIGIIDFLKNNKKKL